MSAADEETEAAFERMLEPEVAGLRLLLEGPDRPVFILAAGMTTDARGDVNAVLCRSISGHAARRHGRAWLNVLDREIRRVKELMGDS